MVINLEDIFKKFCTACYNFSDGYNYGDLIMDRSFIEGLSYYHKDNPNIIFDNIIKRDVAIFSGSNHLSITPAGKTPQFTHIIYIKMDNWGEKRRSSILSCTQTGGLSFEMTSEGKLSIGIHIDGSYKWLTTESNLSYLADQNYGWNVIAVSFDGISLSLYINGEKVSEIIYDEYKSINYGSSSKCFCIGSEAGSGTSNDETLYLKGRIAELSSYCIKLNDDTMKQLSYRIMNKTSEYVSYKNSIQQTILPMNSIDKILNKVNDNREGLLGMANNDENYGELYVVGKDGKSHLTRNGTKCEEIWSGIASSGNITLSKNLSEFKSVAFEVDSSGNRDKICTCMVSMTDNIIETGKFTVNEYSTRNIKFSFSKDNNDLNIVSYQLNVIGIIGFY